MKKLLFIPLVLFLGLFGYCQNPVLSINPQYPEAGDEVIVTYNGTLAKNGVKMAFIPSFEKDFRMPNLGVPTELSNGVLIGKFIVPDSSAFFYIKLMYRGEFDNNNGMGFGFKVYQNGQPRKKAYFSEAQGIKRSKYLFNGEVDYEKALALMDLEYSLNPDIKEETMGHYVTTLNLIPARSNDAYTLANTNFKKILEKGEKFNNSFYYISVLSKGNKAINDSLTNLIIQKFPLGNLSFSKKAVDLQMLSFSDPQATIKAYNNIKATFPNLSVRRETYLYEFLLDAYVLKKDISSFDSTMNAFLKFGNLSSINLVAAEAYHGMGEALLDSNLELSKQYIEKSIDYFTKYDSLSRYYGNVLDTYAKILGIQNNNRKAVFYQKKAINLTAGTYPQFHQRLIEYLIAASQFKEAITEAESFIKEGGISSPIDSLQKVAYIALNGGESGYQDYLYEIKNSGDDSYILKMKGKLIDKVAPDFELKNLDGKIVKLSSFRGKKVILDFWATWCGPCIKAFPAMKQAIEDLHIQGVEFLFIDTFENEVDEKKLIDKIIKVFESKEMDTSLVLLDKKVTNKYQTSTSFGVEGIPAKFIIDTKGRLRYASSGFGTSEVLLKELKTVISLIE